MKTGELDIQGVLHAGEFQLIHEYQVTGSAITTYTISELDGDTDIEYQLVTRFIAGANTSACLLRINNDTGSNYGYQHIAGQSSTASASRGSYDSIILGYGALTSKVSMSSSLFYSKTGFVRTIIQQVVRDISTTTVDLVQNSGWVWNNTADNITSLVIFSDVTGGLGVGTHILLFARRRLGSVALLGTKAGELDVQGKCKTGVMQKIHDYTVAGSSETTHTISGLDGNIDVLYLLECMFVSGAYYPGILLQPNNDSSNTGFQYLGGYGASVIAYRYPGSQSVIGYPGASGKISASTTLLYAKSGYIRTYLTDISEMIDGTTIGELNLRGVSWNNTADNITSLVIFSDAANGLGIGTNIRLYALRKKS